VSAKPSGRTQATINAEPVPRLPHERDESSDSQTNGVRPVIQQAHDDLEAGKVDTDRGPPMDEAYQRQKANTKKSTRP
jgi:DNA invertase Pin-like site-specific DNA recombinase